MIQNLTVLTQEFVRLVEEVSQARNLFFEAGKVNGGHG
jgi:hypothetical protein